MPAQSSAATGSAPRRIALVTPMVPVPHDPTRGRYIHETARALSKLAVVRVFFMQPRYPPIPGLAPRSFLDGRVSAGHKLDGIDMETFSYPAIPGLSRLLNGVVASQALTPRLRRFDADLVLAYWLYPDGYAAQRSAARLGLPCIIGARGSDIHVRSGISRTLTRRAVARADALLTVSQAMRRTAIAEYGAAPGRSHAIVNGYNGTVFRAQPQAAARAELGIDPGVRLILYVGRFVASKGMHELLEAFGRLQSRDPSLRLALVGDGVMRDELAQTIATTGMTERIFLPGGGEPEDVARWMAAANVLTLPSWSEGYPNVVVEAIACGRPVVATDVGGTREIITADTGLLIPPRDALALERALDSALQRDWDYQLIADAMRRSWADVAADTLGVCERVIARHGGGHG